MSSVHAFPAAGKQLPAGLQEIADRNHAEALGVVPAPSPVSMPAPDRTFAAVPELRDDTLRAHLEVTADRRRAAAIRAAKAAEAVERAEDLVREIEAELAGYGAEDAALVERRAAALADWATNGGTRPSMESDPALSAFGMRKADAESRRNATAAALSRLRQDHEAAAAELDDATKAVEAAARACLTEEIDAVARRLNETLMHARDLRASLRAAAGLFPHGEHLSELAKRLASDAWQLPHVTAFSRNEPGWLAEQAVGPKWRELRRRLEHGESDAGLD